MRENSPSITGITEQLASCITSVSYEALSEEVVSMAKVVTRDGIANMLAGSTQPLGQILIKYVRSRGEFQLQRSLEPAS